MPATAYSYCCYTACIIGFQFVTDQVLDIEYYIAAQL